MRILFCILLFFSFSTAPGKTKKSPTSSSMSINQDESSIVVFGDSNLHKWDIKANKFSGEGSFEIKEGSLKKVNNFKLTVDAKEIKSDSDTMNEKTATALETEKYPKIFGVLKNSKIEGDSISGKMEFKIHGVKKIADFTSKISFAENKLVVEGEQDLSMTDFQIEPPVTNILFIKATAKPELKIKYKLTLK